MTEDLNLSSAQYDWLLTGFYCTYYISMDDTSVVRGDMSPISLFNAVGDTFLIGVSVSERGNLHSQIGSHIL